MIWYTAHYGTWANGGHVTKIDFGKYCYGTYDRKEAFDKAQKTANETKEIVTVVWGIPTIRGLDGHAQKVDPNK